MEFKALMESRVSRIDERLKKIEAIIEKLQTAILGKIGSYGQSLQEIKDEIKATQQSFAKIINPLVDKANRQIKTSKKSKKSNFEDYLR